MAEYIDREALLKRANEVSGGSFAVGFILAAILNAPAADVAEVVRCKDCQYSSNTAYGEEIGRCCCDFFYKIVPLNHFCSYGVAKSNEKE